MKKIFSSVIALLSVFAMLQPASALVYNVTVPAGTNACFIAGDMNSWSPSASRMTKVDATHYTIEFPNALATNQYKYLSGPDWAYEEKDAAGAPLAANRTWTEADVVAKWGSVFVFHEGDVLIQVLVPLNTVECYVVGNFNNWPSPSASDKMTKGATTVDGIIFSKTIHTLDSSSLEYKFIAGPAWAYEQKTPSANFKYSVDGATVVVTEFKAIYDPALTGTINITATVPSGTTRVWIQGDFLGWNMANAIEGAKNIDGTFSFSIPMVMTIEYRLYNKADWAYPEVGEADPTKELPNRMAVYPADANKSITVWGWKTSTGLEQILINNKVYSVDGILTVENVTSKVEVFDFSSRLVQQKKLTGTFKSDRLMTGLYILRVDGKIAKMLVK